jgi:hypothetical protein
MSRNISEVIMFTPGQYRDAITTIKMLEAETESKKTKQNSLKHHLQYEVYQPKIRAIEKERDEALEKVTIDFNSFKAKQEELLKPNREVVRGIKECISLMRVDGTQDLTIEIYSYRNKDEDGHYYRNAEGGYENRKIFYTPIDTIIQDQYKNIQVFIVKNGKPTNRYTLTVQGKSIFHNLTFVTAKDWRCYVNGVIENTNIRLHLKDAPTTEALQKWYDKNKANLLKDFFLAEHAQVEKRYEEAKELYKKTEWKILYLKQLQDECRVGEDDFNDYKALIKILSRSPKDLVLLVNVMKSEEGKRMLERLLKE